MSDAEWSPPMNVDLRIQFGIRGQSQSLSPLWLDVGSVGATSSWAGSCHILAMGRHYDDYVITGQTISLPIHGFPEAHPYARLASKIRAAGVTGNIGEAIAAIVAQRVLHGSVGDVAHISSHGVGGSSKSPDYLMRLGDLVPGPFNAVIPSGVVVAGPTWWPVESKARKTTSALASAQKKALRQLVAYWFRRAVSEPSAVGYGMIVVFVYEPPREVRVSLILPSKQNDLVDAFAKNKGPGIDDAILNACLHEC